MYVPHFNAVSDDAEIRAMVAAVGAGQLVTTGADGYPLATLLPLLWEGDTVRMHLARANPHWQAITESPEGTPALIVVSGAQAYISPSWYASKPEHGRVVPTWNYSGVHLLGRARVTHDADWLLRAVDDLVVAHESGRAEPWATSDAPEKYVRGQLRAIVGVEFAVERVDGKAKLSQNRSEADQQGIVAGLRAEPVPDAGVVADQMAARLTD